MNPPQSAIENSLVSARQAVHDPVYREALWVSVVFTGMVIAAALLEWLKSNRAIILGELLVLMETAAIYARAALASRLSRRDDTLMEFLTGVILGPLAILAVLSSLSLLITPAELNPPNFLKLFSLVLAIEFLSVFVLIEERSSALSLSELFGPRIFAWFAHCALLVTGMYSVLVPNTTIDAGLGLCVATVCMLSAANYIHDAVTRMAAE